MSEQARALYQRWKEQQAAQPPQSRRSSALHQPCQQSRPMGQQSGRPTSPSRSTATAQGTDVVLGTSEVTGASVLLPYTYRDHHLMIVGGTGTGKTTLLERLICQDIIDHTACVVFDVHGDMTENLLRFVSTQPAWAARTLVVDLTGGDDPPFGANLYECPDPTLRNQELVERTVAGVLAYLQRFWGEDLETRPVIARGLRNTTRTIIANPGYTMAEVPLLFFDQALRARLLARVRNPLVHAYWQAYDRLTRELDREIWRDSLVNKLEQFLENEVTYPVLSQERSTIAWEEILSNGYCLLIRLPLSAGEQSMEYLNALLLNQLARHLAARAGTTDVKNRPRVHLYLDEYRRLASEQTTTLLYEARKANVGVTVAMQSLEDLESKVARDATLQTATRIAFRTTSEVAKAVATTFAPAPNQVPVKKGICQNPVDYLVSHTHPNPEVRALTQTSLAPLLVELERAAGTRISTTRPAEPDPMVDPRVARYFRSLWSPTPSPSVSEMSAEAVRLSTARTELNKLLVDVMEGRETPGARQVLGRILDVFFERFGGKPHGVCVYIAATTIRDLVTPGTPEAQALVTRIRSGVEVGDFVHLCLGGETAQLNLRTVKQSGLNGAAVAVADERVAAVFKARQRKRYEGGGHYPLPRFPAHFSTGGVDFVADMYAGGDPRYTTYLSPFEHSTFAPVVFSRADVAELVAKTRESLRAANVGLEAARGHRVAFMDKFGESALVMTWIWQLMLERDDEFHSIFVMSPHVRRNYCKPAPQFDTVIYRDKAGNQQRTVYWSPQPEDYRSAAGPPLGCERPGDVLVPAVRFTLPLVTGLPLARAILLISDYAESRGLDAWQPIPGVGSLKLEREERQPPSARDPGVTRVYDELVAQVNHLKATWSGPPREANLTARLLLHKARLAVHSQEYANCALPDDIICPGGQWPRLTRQWLTVSHPDVRRSGTALYQPVQGTASPVRAKAGPPRSGKPVAAIVQELRELLVALDIERHLAKEKEDCGQELYEHVKLPVTALTGPQLATVTKYCRHQLLGDEQTKRDTELQAAYPHEYRFLSDLNRLCELLTKEPIEVSAGPQEERPQTTADVINEVERQLTQLDNWKAYHALLQEDGTINADKITLLSPPPRPPDNPQVIDEIRHRSRQRFSRPRAEIDAATARRRDTTPHPATSTEPPQPPGTGTPTPPPATRPKPRQPGQQPPPEPPDTKPPPIGRR